MVVLGQYYSRMIKYMYILQQTTLKGLFWLVPHISACGGGLKHIRQNHECLCVLNDFVKMPDIAFASCCYTWIYEFFFFDNDINRLLKTWVFVHVCGVDWMYNFYQLHDVYGVYCGNSVIIYLLFLYVKQNNCISLETTTTDLCLKPTSKNYLSCTALKISKF